MRGRYPPLDRETLEWVKVALKESLADETSFHIDAVTSLTRQLEQVKHRINQSYSDKLDGKISEEFWAEKTKEWQIEKARISGELSRHLEADDRYVEDGVRLLELAQRAYELYAKQDARGKRRLLGTLLSNCHLAEGRITPTYRQPFDIMVLMAREAEKQPPVTSSAFPVSSMWGG